MKLTSKHTWQEVADRLSLLEGKQISHQAACQAGDRLLKKLKVIFLRDPMIRDWLIEQGVDVEDR